MPFFKFLVFIAITVFAGFIGWAAGEAFKNAYLAISVSAAVSFAGVTILTSEP